MKEVENINNNFVVTPEAAKQIGKLAFEKLITVNDDIVSKDGVLIDLDNTIDLTEYYFKLEVLGGGCSGFQYKYYMSSDSVDVGEYIEIISDIKYSIKALKDKVAKCKVKVVIDKTSMQFLNGSKLEYIKELGASYFQISNPNAQSKCGCGNSFSI